MQFSWLVRYWVHCDFFLSNSVDPVKNLCRWHIVNSGSLWTLFNTFLMQILLKFDEHPASLLFNNLLREKRDPPQSFVVDFLVKTFLLKIMQSTFKFQHPIALNWVVFVYISWQDRLKFNTWGYTIVQSQILQIEKKSIPYVRSKNLILSKLEWRKKSFCLFGIFYYL